MNWDDLRIIAAVRDEGTYAGASARLRVDETTVGRRLARIERALGLRLFEAADGVRTPTRQCEMVLAHVQAMAAHAEDIGRIGESLPGPVGRLRVASTNAVAEEVLAPRASDFLRANPGLTLQFLTSSDNVKFSRWEADLAIRLRKPDKGDFAISKLAEVRLYFFEPITAAATGEAVTCAYPDELEGIPEMQFLRARRIRARCVTDNVRVIRTLIQSHQAAGVLPEYGSAALLADRRLRATLLPKRRDVWLLVQNHLKRDPAARVTIDWVRSCFQDVSRG
ncbi:LysR family transcriptional regulator [Bradyrhizobium sp. ISRA443]|uniref:LysR family transcriptional regulator n=1 Tax=unclassified Bradyrhizobium TaxID=2631580 RepID=UPI00247A667E|nr:MULTISPECIES: LysR family transcriptional regulator [unclassified Bradyrhizobium]WGR91493.1 LysR family transcriptional regulator [Bradyrhizobium sp. ISRA435]WGS01770.1 LysR family transcriptional regulator [Bradyrhizobium sp. ISRA436]WGS08656.1 LysR family transcriptional regulator [Bradyrhizobium sp. ISRA437]WGS15544.1 LysR family transcriptional regulator [Bradyrhizobium sp. ISRA443]